MYVYVCTKQQLISRMHCDSDEVVTSHKGTGRDWKKGDGGQDVRRLESFPQSRECRCSFDKCFKTCVSKPLRY